MTLSLDHLRHLRLLTAATALVPLLAPHLPKMPTVRHVVVAGPGSDPSALVAPAGVTVHGYDDLVAGRPAVPNAASDPGDDKAGTSMPATRPTSAIAGEPQTSAAGRGESYWRGRFGAARDKMQLIAT